MKDKDLSVIDSEDKHLYDDMLLLPHKVSEKRRHMSLRDRAAQFSPFAALTGYNSAINETARATGERKILTDEEKAIIDRKLFSLSAMLHLKPKIKITYFVRDSYKEGGEYVTVYGNVKKIGGSSDCVLLQSGISVQIDDIIDISAEYINDEDL